MLSQFKDTKHMLLMTFANEHSFQLCGPSQRSGTHNNLFRMYANTRRSTTSVLTVQKHKKHVLQNTKRKISGLSLIHEDDKIATPFPHNVSYSSPTISYSLHCAEINAESDRHAERANTRCTHSPAGQANT